MPWTTSTSDLRTLLSDNATDKLAYRKKVINNPNGVITAFKTFEFRRLTDFTTATAPLGVYVDGVIAAVSSDDLATGEFILAAPPTEGQLIESTYYVQWFLDAELDVFLNQGTQWLLLGIDPTQVPEGLQTADLQYAAHLAYQKLALRFAMHVSETFRLEDAPDKNRYALVDAYAKMADMYLKQATQVRDSYYTRSGQNLSPLFATNSGAVREIVPPR